MNYQKVYENLISKAKQQNRVKLKKDNSNYVYYENHHIIPKSLGGENEKENLVLLTEKEHYIVHKLLVKIYSGRKMNLAFHKMTYSKNGDHIKSSRDYKYARELNSEAMMGKNHPMFGRKHSKESIKKMCKPHKSPPIEYKKLLKEIRKGKGNPMFGKKHSKESIKKMSNIKTGKKYLEETRKKMGESRKGKKLSEETKEKIRKSNLGKSSPMKGKKLSEETKKKMSESTKGKNHPFYGKETWMKGKKHSKESKKKISESMKGRIPWNKK